MTLQRLLFRTTIRSASHLTLRLLALCLLGFVTSHLVACKATSSQPQRQTVTPADFSKPVEQEPAYGVNVAPTTAPDAPQTPVDEGNLNTSASLATPPDQTSAASAPSTTKPTQPQATEATPTNNTPPAQQQPDEQPQPVLTLDAMVGQVNGQAIYASSVFKPIEAQLTALGKTLPPSVFRKRAIELIAGQLQTIVTNALILGIAERDLTIQERYGLVAMVQMHREDLLRQFGEGAVSVANKNSLDDTGKNIDQQVDEYRQQVLVGRYISKAITPKVNVTRKDIERYYQNHAQEFNPPAGRTLRLIMATSQADANTIQKLLDEGQSFEQVAKNPANKYRPSDGGLMPNLITGNKFSHIDALNQAMSSLQAGQHSPMIKESGAFWWVMVQTYEAGKTKTLKDVQIQIRQILENQQRDKLGMEFRQKIMAEGSYNPIDQMTKSLIEIAMSRYSTPD